MKGETYNNKPIYTFVDDKKDGGMIVECSVCEGQFDVLNGCNTIPRFQTTHTCPHCRSEVIYPEYASW
jgi:ribosomal protein L33